MSVGIPIKVLHDAEGHVVTLETVSGEVFRGKLVEAEDNMNVHMCDLIMTSRDGRTSNLQQVYIRGSKIRYVFVKTYCFFRFLILPDMLKNSPMLKRPQGAKGLGTGRGKNAMLRAGGKFLKFKSNSPLSSRAWNFCSWTCCDCSWYWKNYRQVLISPLIYRVTEFVYASKYPYIYIIPHVFSLFASHMSFDVKLMSIAPTLESPI